jgi:outer membrane immunogenic protein
MKRFASTLGVLLASVAGSAYAADLPRPPTPYSKAPPIVSPLTNWSGFYIGAMGGYASENSSGDIGIKGGFGGGTVGYNWQFSNIVAGIEADGAFASIRASAADSAVINGFSVSVSGTDKVDALATVRGRIGVAFDQVLLFGTGGFALANEKSSFTALVATGGVAVGATVSDTKTQTGWTAGAGIEWMFLPRWSLKAEYLYRRFDNTTVFGVPAGTLALNSGQFGINYHF